MSSEDAAFALAEQMKKSSAELHAGMARVAKALEALPEPLNQIVLSLSFQRANTIPNQGPPQNAGPLKPRDTTPTPRAVAWRPFKTGTPGGWCNASENEPLRDTLLAAKPRSVVLENYTYRLSGDKDQYIQRFPVGPRK